MARFFLAGCGYVGSALGAELVRDGHEVSGMRRRPDGLPTGIVPIAGDLGDPGSVRAALGRAGAAPDVVVYAAAADRGDDESYRRAYVDGLRNVLDALADSGARPGCVLFTSSTGVYAQRDGQWVDETSPTEPTDFRGTRMLEAEALLAASSLPATALRLGGLYGPGRTRLVESVASGRATLRPGPPRYTNRIHRDDAAGALRHLAARALAGEPLEALYLGVDDEPADDRTVLPWIAERLGVAPPPVVEAAGDGDALAPGRGASNKRCRNARLRASGYALRFPTFREGYAGVIDAWRREHGGV